MSTKAKNLSERKSYLFFFVFWLIPSCKGGGILFGRLVIGDNQYWGGRVSGS